MKLYYTPGVCSLSPHIALREAGLTPQIEKVDLKTHRTETGKDFYQINPKGYVPALVLDSGEVLTEGVAIIQYIADQNPKAGIAPANGTIERTRLQEWLNYISTEIHKGFSPLFNPEVGEQAAEIFRAKLKKNFDYLSGQLKGKKYLMGEQFTVADGYLFTTLNWTKLKNIDLSQWPVLVEYQQRVASRPKVQETLKAEGLLEAKAA